MPEEPIDANTASESSTDEATTQETETETQAGEKPVVETKESDKAPFHEHPRFQELISSNRELKSQIEALKNQQMQSRSQETPQKSAITRAIERYVSKGVDPQIARELVEDQVAIANEISSRQTMPLYETQQQANLKVAFETFKATHKDYEEVRPEMLEVLNSLPLAIKVGFVQSPSEGLDLIYDRVMSTKRAKLESDAVQKGKDEAYSKKKEKSAQASSSTSSPEMSDDEKELAEMDLATYMKPENQAKYNKLEQKYLDNLR